MPNPGQADAAITVEKRTPIQDAVDKSLRPTAQGPVFPRHSPITGKTARDPEAWALGDDIDGLIRGLGLALTYPIQVGPEGVWKDITSLGIFDKNKDRGGGAPTGDGVPSMADTIQDLMERSRGPGAGQGVLGADTVLSESSIEIPSLPAPGHKPLPKDISAELAAAQAKMADLAPPDQEANHFQMLSAIGTGLLAGNRPGNTMGDLLMSAGVAAAGGMAAQAKEGRSIRLEQDKYKRTMLSMEIDDIKRMAQVEDEIALIEYENNEIDKKAIMATIQNRKETVQHLADGRILLSTVTEGPDGKLIKNTKLIMSEAAIAHGRRIKLAVDLGYGIPKDLNKVSGPVFLIQNVMRKTGGSLESIFPNNPNAIDTIRKAVADAMDDPVTGYERKGPSKSLAVEQDRLLVTEIYKQLTLLEAAKPGSADFAYAMMASYLQPRPIGVD